MVRTHEVSEIEPGVFYTILEPCSVAVLPHVLAPEPASIVWSVDHMPLEALVWTEMPVPLAADSPCERLRVRGVQYDFQMPTREFLDRVLPRLPLSNGIVLFQLDRPVPDTLLYRRLAELPRKHKHAILRRSGWRLTFELPHGGEYAEVTAAERAEVERILAAPAIAARKAGGELP